jgi:hypothetical protein
MYYDELPAGSIEEAADYFIDHKRDDVTLVRVELVGPDEPGTREFANSPILPFRMQDSGRLQRPQPLRKSLQKRCLQSCLIRSSQGGRAYSASEFHLVLNPAPQAGLSQGEPSALRKATDRLTLPSFESSKPHRAESPNSESLG